MMYRSMYIDWGGLWECGDDGLGGNVFVNEMKFGIKTVCNTSWDVRSTLRLWRTLRRLDWNPLNARFYIVYSSTSLEYHD